MTVIIQRDEAAEATVTRYRYTRVVETARHIVRVRIERDFYYDKSLAVAELLNDRKTWSHLADELPDNWWHTTPTTRPHVNPAAVLGPVADRLVRHAANILTPPTTALTVSPRVLDAVSGLLATSDGYNGERRITTEDVAFAHAYGGTLHMFEHLDGSITFTKQHRDNCPFITSTGTQDCDHECHFNNPADVTGRLGT